MSTTDINEDFQPELIVRASKADKAKAKRRRSMIEDESPGIPWRKVFGSIIMVLCGIMTVACVADYMAYRDLANGVGLLVGQGNAHGVFNTGERLFNCFLFGGFTAGGLWLFRSGKAA